MNSPLNDVERLSLPPRVLGADPPAWTDGDRRGKVKTDDDSWLDESLRDVGTPRDTTEGSPRDVGDEGERLRIRIDENACENCGHTTVRDHHQGCAAPIVYVGGEWQCGDCGIRASTSTSCSNCGESVDRKPEPVPIDLSLPFEGTDVERAIHRETNRRRDAHGEDGLAYSEHLAAIALRHSRAMAQVEFFDHTAPDGSEAIDRYCEFGHDASRCGENLALVYPDRSDSVTDAARAVVDSWMDSPGHRKALLKGAFEKEGIGVHLDPSGALYATQNFY
jgi:uncharacterized protein YkwD